MNYRTLLVNTYILKNEARSDPLTIRLYRALQSNCLEIEHALHKIKHQVQKRGLINILGSGIKFIAGNPDSNDLRNIQSNIDALFKTQQATLSKINSLTSFANHLTNRYSNDLNIIMKNINETKSVISTLKNNSDMRIIIQAEIYQAIELLEIIKMIQRTISFAWKNIPNLEIITSSELVSIQNHLTQIYPLEQLPHLDLQYPFQIIEFSEIVVLGIEQTITFLLKIPVTKSSTAQYSQILPVPNKQNLILIPPQRYTLYTNQSQYWTSQPCKETEKAILCTEMLTTHSCKLDVPSNCTFAHVTNNYQATIRLRNRQILTIIKEPLEIIEDCRGHLTRTEISKTSILESTCRIIIHDEIYDDSKPMFEIPFNNISKLAIPAASQEVQLYQRHLGNLAELKADLKELEQQPLHLNPVLQWAHGTLTGMVILLLVVAGIIITKFRQRIIELFCKPRRVINIRTANLNEDVQI